MKEREVDYKQFEKERIISVSDLFEEILRKIWLVIILAVAFAIICAGYKYMSDKSKAERPTSTTAYEKNAASLTDKEMSEVNSVLILYGEVEGLNQYLSESIRMNIDPYHEEQVVMQFALETQYENPTEILTILDSYVEEGPLSIDLEEYYPDVDSTYLAELVTLNSENATLDLSDEEVTAYQSNLFSVKVIHMDAESCRQLADDVYQCLNSYLDRIADYFGSCEIELIDENAFQIYDNSLRNSQMSILSDLITQQGRISTQEGSLSDEQLEVLEALLAGQTDKDESTSVAASSENVTEQEAGKVHISKRYLLIGIVIGVVLAIIIIVLYYIFRGTLNVAQEMQSEFDISVFGQLHVKKPKNPLVRAWRRITNKKKALSLETEQQIAFTNLKNFCRNHQVSHILLTGSRPDLIEDAWLKGLKDQLRGEGIEAEIAGALPDAPETMEKLDAYSHIALVETLHVSPYKDVIREIEICKEQNIQVAGAILLS